MFFCFATAILFISYGLGLQAQTVAVSVELGPVTAGGKVKGTISMASSGALKPAALQWTLTYPSAAGMANPTFSTSAAAVAAGKSVRCSTSQNASACILYGLNDTVLLDGTVATITFDAPSVIPAEPVVLEVKDVAASSAEGEAIAAEGHGATVSFAAPVSVARLSCPETVMAPAVVSCSITTSGPAAADVSLKLLSDAPGVIVPAGVTLRSGEDTARFNVSVAAGAAGQNVKIAARSGATQAEATLNVTSGGDAVLLFNAATYAADGVCSPGAAVSAFGVGLTDGSAAAAPPDGPLPRILSDIQVLSGGRPLPLFYAGPGQVNFQCPSGDPGDAVDVTLRTSTGSKAPVTLRMQAATPGLYALGANGSGQGAILIAGSSTVAMPTPRDGIPGRPAKAGEFLELYGSGFGVPDGNWRPGMRAPSDRLLSIVYPVRVIIGGVEAVPTFAGLAPGAAGLYQINVQLPMGVPSGDSIPVFTRVYLADGTVADSNVVTIAVSAAQDGQSRE